MTVIGTTQAASILGVSTARVRQLLATDRIVGAYKLGKCWAIPLFDGKISITKGKRGPKPKEPRGRAQGKTKVYIDRAKLANNFKQGLYEPVISVNRNNKYISGHEISVDGPCKVVYNPEANRNPRIWIETIYGVRVFSKNLEGEIISRQLVS